MLHNLKLSKGKLALSKRAESLCLSKIKQTMQLGATRVDTLGLNLGECQVAPPEKVLLEVARQIPNNESLSQYSLSQGLPELRSELSIFLRERHLAGEVDPASELLITVGCTAALTIGLQALVDPGDEVVVFAPYYPSHVQQILLAGGTPVFVPLKIESNWSPDLDALRSVITQKTKVILVCSPSNPTGTIFSIEELTEITNLAEENGIYILADQVYQNLTYENNTCVSLASSAFDYLRDQIVFTSSFSKMFCISGWRIGFVYAPREMISRALNIHDASVFCVPTPSQLVALESLKFLKTDEGENWFLQLSDSLCRRRNLMVEHLKSLPELFSIHCPLAGISVFPALNPHIKVDTFYKMLFDQTGVLIVPGTAFGEIGEGHLRFSFGAHEETIHQAFDRIRLWYDKKFGDLVRSGRAVL